MKKQVALISKQPLPVIYGIWQQKPDFVSFLVTEGYEQVVENIVSVAEQNHKFNYNVIDVDPYDKEKMKDYFSNLDDKSDWSINVTGGTKIMSILATMYGSQMKAEIFYVKPSANKEEILYPFSSRENQTVEFKLNVEQYLKAHGQLINSYRKDIDEIKNKFPLTNFIVRNDWVIKFINEVRSKSYSGIKGGDCFDKDYNEYFMKITFNKTEKKSISTILIEYGLKSNPAKIELKRDTYITGGWLEEYIYLQTLNYADDVMINVEIESKVDKINPLNEIDVIAIKNNRLHIISCKTDKKLKPAAQYQLVWYQKLAGGIFAIPYLISVSTPGPLFKERLNEYKIKSVFGKKIIEFCL